MSCRGVLVMPMPEIDMGEIRNKKAGEGGPFVPSRGNILISSQDSTIDSDWEMLALLAFSDSDAKDWRYELLDAVDGRMVGAIKGGRSSGSEQLCGFIPARALTIRVSQSAVGQSMGLSRGRSEVVAVPVPVYSAGKALHVTALRAMLAAVSK